MFQKKNSEVLLHSSGSRILSHGKVTMSMSTPGKFRRLDTPDSLSNK
jgi:hypothetical protein